MDSDYKALGFFNSSLLSMINEYSAAYSFRFKDKLQSQSSSWVQAVPYHHLGLRAFLDSAWIALALRIQSRTTNMYRNGQHWRTLQNEGALHQTCGNKQNYRAYKNVVRYTEFAWKYVYSKTYESPDILKLLTYLFFFKLFILLKIEIEMLEVLSFVLRRAHCNSKWKKIWIINIKKRLSVFFCINSHLTLYTPRLYKFYCYIHHFIHSFLD